MDEVNLMLETGSDALDELSSTEKNAILAKYDNGEESIAALHVFKLLMRKFKPTYRMGRMYEALSDKYVAYRDIYNHYAKTVRAGSLAKDVDEITKYDIERWKWPSQTKQSN